MTKRLLVGIGETGEMAALLPDLTDLLRSLRALGVVTQVAVIADETEDVEFSVPAELLSVTDVGHLGVVALSSAVARMQDAIGRVSPETAGRLQDLRTYGRRRWIRKPDCVYLHGVRAAPLLGYLRAVRVPVTVHLPSTDDCVAALPIGDRRELVGRADRFLVADESAVGPLLASGVDPGRVISVEDLRSLVPPPPTSDSTRARARTALGLPCDRPVVAVPPAPGWVDLPDLTLAVARDLDRLSDHDAPILWWYGMPAGGDRRWLLDFDVDRMGLDNVHLMSRTPSWNEVLDAADAVVFPIDDTGALPPDFAREAARRGVPLWCWEGHARAAEVACWGGAVVQRGDVETLATTVHGAVATPARRRRARAAAWMKAMAEIERFVPLGVPFP